MTKGVESSQRGDSNVAQRGKETIDSSIGKKSQCPGSSKELQREPEHCLPPEKAFG